MKEIFKKLTKFLKNNRATTFAFIVFFILLGLKLTYRLRDVPWFVITLPVLVEMMTRMF